MKKCNRLQLITITNYGYPMSENNIKKVQAMYMGFLNYNKIFDIDILNLETGCSKICDDLDHVV
jgi:hypothetical protein